MAKCHHFNTTARAVAIEIAVPVVLGHRNITFSAGYAATPKTNGFER